MKLATHSHLDEGKSMGVVSTGGHQQPVDEQWGYCLSTALSVTFDLLPWQQESPDTLSVSETYTK